MTAFMNQQHPQAKKAQAFEKVAYKAAKSLLDRPGLAMDAGVQALLLRSLSLSNTGSLSALRQGLPTVEPRLYVARDIAKHLSKEEQDQHKLSLENGLTCFRGFRDKSTCIRILAPEWNIDGNYLGKETAQDRAYLDPLLLKTKAYGSASGTTDLAKPESETSTQVLSNPSNISDRDFRLLRGNLLYSGLAFSQEDDDLKNNVSVVFLLEWCGKRLLFTGDAEWDGTGVQKGQRNSSWDVMLDNQDVSAILLKPLDMFKVAHHGSHNGTPFDQQGTVQVLSKIATPDRTNIIVSTVVGVHGKKNPVPYAPLLKGLGEKAANKRIYPGCESALKELAQPQRTDLESDSTDPSVDYLEVTIKPEQ